MSVTYRISPEDHIVYLTTVGEAPFDELKGVMLSVLADPAYRPGFDFLSDRSRETDVPGPLYVRQCIDFLREHLREMGSYRWALVSDTPALDRMLRMFSMLAETRGVRAEAFRTVDEAREWLREGRRR